MVFDKGSADIYNESLRKLRVVTPARSGRNTSRRRAAEDKFLRRVSDEINLYKRRRGKRTEHARQRHAQGQRPTREAFRDAASLRDGSLYVDTRRSTYLVHGPQRRAHMFSRQGRHVTSFRLAEGELERKCRRERWRLASSTMYQEFRNLIELKEK